MTSIQGVGLAPTPQRGDTILLQPPEGPGVYVRFQYLEICRKADVKAVVEDSNGTRYRIPFDERKLEAVYRVSEAEIASLSHMIVPSHLVDGGKP